MVSCRSVNLKFLPEPVFQSKLLAAILLLTHVVLLWAFADRRWCARVGGLSAAAWKCLLGSPPDCPPTSDSEPSISGGSSSSRIKQSRGPSEGPRHRKTGPSPAALPEGLLGVPRPPRKVQPIIVFIYQSVCFFLHERIFKSAFLKETKLYLVFDGDQIAYQYYRVLLSVARGAAWCSQAKGTAHHSPQMFSPSTGMLRITPQNRVVISHRGCLAFPDQSQGTTSCNHLEALPMYCPTISKAPQCIKCCYFCHAAGN